MRTLPAAAAIPGDPLPHGITLTMKFQLDTSNAPTVRAQGPGWVKVGNDEYRTSLVLHARGTATPWPVADFDALSALHFEQLAALRSELVIFGSGARIRFPNPAWLVSLYAQRIGIETMDNAAACRTYNVLASEGRDVVLALLLPG